MKEYKVLATKALSNWGGIEIVDTGTNDNFDEVVKVRENYGTPGKVTTHKLYMGKGGYSYFNYHGRREYLNTFLLAFDSAKVQKSRVESFENQL